VTMGLAFTLLLMILALTGLILALTKPPDA
jgi:uncharacterized iron-regulated membrane protein